MRHAVGGAPASRPGPVYLLDYSLATFTRSGEAALVDPRNGWAFDPITPWPGTDVPRILSDGAILIEGSRTNLVTDSRALDAASWSTIGSATVTADAVAGPDGAMTADEVVTPSGNTYRRKILGGLTAGSTYVASLYGAAKAGTTAQWGFNDNAGQSAYKVHTPGAIVRSDNGVSAFGSTTGIVLVAYGGDASGFGGLAAGARDMYADLVQVESGAFPTSPIRTAGAAVTRGVEKCSFADGSILDSGRWSVTFAHEGTHAELAALSADSYLFVRHDTNNMIQVSRGGGSPRVRLIANAVTQIDAAITWSRDQLITLTVDWDARTLTIAGATTGNGTFALAGAGDWTSALSTTLYVGAANSGGSGPWFGAISRPVAA